MAAEAKPGRASWHTWCPLDKRRGSNRARCKRCGIARLQTETATGGWWGEYILTDGTKTTDRPECVGPELVEHAFVWGGSVPWVECACGVEQLTVRVTEGQMIYHRRRLGDEWTHDYIPHEEANTDAA